MCSHVCPKWKGVSNQLCRARRVSAEEKASLMSGGREHPTPHPTPHIPYPTSDPIPSQLNPTQLNPTHPTPPYPNPNLNLPHPTHPTHPTHPP